MTPKPTLRTFLSAAIGILVLAACSLLPARLDPTEKTATVLALTPTAIPATSTPLPPLAVLIAPVGSDPSLAAEMETQMKVLAEAAGMRFQVRPSLSTAELSQDMAIVAGLAPDPGMAGLAQAAPTTRFIGVGIAGLDAANNLTAIQAQVVDAQDLAFIAGYIAAVITPDWRGGVLLPPDTATAQQIESAFANGLHFWCGLCQPAYAPFVVYPQSAQVADPADAVTTLAKVDELTNMGVTTFYVPPELGSDALFTYIAQKPALIIATTPPSGTVAGQWVVSLRSGNPAGSFAEAWADALAGKTGYVLSVPLELADTGSGILDEARQRVVTEMLSELSRGLISPETIAD